MKKNENKFLITKRSLLIFLVLITSPIVTVAKEVFIKDSNNSSSVSCDYKSLIISESGNMEIILNNYQACVGSATGGTVNTDCSFEGISYSKGATKTFYKTNTDCSNPIIATCGDNDFPPNGYRAGECKEDVIISTEGWLTDTLSVGSNVTSVDLYGGAGSPETYEVYTLDGGGATAVPGCANNKSFNACGKASDWLPGARTNQVYAVRNKKDSSKGITINFTPNSKGINIQPAIYDVTISSNPGQMNLSTFIGRGCVNRNNSQKTFNIRLVSERNKDFADSTAGACYVPKGDKYYINIIATTPECDQVGEKDPKGRKDSKGNVIVLGPCNSYYETH